MKNGKVVSYKMVTDIDLERFEESVNKALAEGWELFGKYRLNSATGHSGRNRFSREMVKYRDANIAKTGETK